MKLRNLPARIVFATLLATSALTAPQSVLAQGVPVEEASAAAFRLFGSGQYAEAVQAYEAIIKDYPTALQIWDARFRAGYLHFLLGDYDKSLVRLREIKDPAPAELKELAASVIPQALAAKAGQEKDEKKRTTALKEALTAYDNFLKAFPQSQQIETATYGRALCAFQLGEYTQAIEGLRRNLQQFARSESIQDSQYLLALALATEGSQGLKKNSSDAAALAKLDEAHKILQAIIDSKQSLALINDAQFQVGEIFFNRALLGPHEQQETNFGKALEAYRSVQGVAPVVQAQTARIRDIERRRIAAGQARDVATYRRLERLGDNERAKLEAIKAKGDLTLSAQVKSAQVFFHQKGYDEARVLLRHLQKFVKDEDEKKQILYFMPLTYASQNLRDQAVQAYDQFQAAYKGDPMADNLPLVVGALFLNPPPDPAKATQYFEEGAKLYPKGRFVAETMNAQGSALLLQGKYPEAIKTFENFLKTNPDAEQASRAEMGIANALRETKKLPEASAAYRKVRDERSETSQAELAAYWVGEIAAMSNDFPTVITEMTTFLEKYPKSQVAPNATFRLAQAETPKNKARAMELYKKITEEWPDNQMAAYAYFQQVQLLNADQKHDEIIALLTQFIERYPESPMLFNAYQTIAQIKLVAGDLPAAIGYYSQMVEKHPNDPNAPVALLMVAQYWMQHTDAQGNYGALNEEQRTEWKRGIDGSLKAGEQMLTAYPTSPQVALTLKTLLANQRAQVSAQLKKEADVVTYFEELAEKFSGSPETRSKVLFTLASYLHKTDKEKAFAIMSEAYSPALVYAPDDIDLYGGELLARGQVAESTAAYTKLLTDYPNPPGVDPTRAPNAIQEAQAISLYGRAKALTTEGKSAEALPLFTELKRLYPWSPKLLEANYEIAESHFRAKEYDKALGLLIPIIRANTVTPDVGAKAILLLGKVQEAQGDIPSAIDQYIKVFVFFESADEPAAEGLWLGGQLLEKQAATLPESVPAKSKEPTKPQQLGKAYRAYEDLVNKYPNSEHAAKAKERRDALQAYAPTPKKK